MKGLSLFAIKCIQLLLFISIIALTVFSKYDRNTLYANQTASMQISSWEGASFDADEDYLIELFNTFTPIFLPKTSEKKSFQAISLANHFSEIVIPPPNLSM
ncbi:MAG: hypothetical protein FGM61_07710 [Sediminibacterium sp.]|nr:hypothetical protein [Sediminibacterium sp.]